MKFCKFNLYSTLRNTVFAVHTHYNYYTCIHSSLSVVAKLIWIPSDYIHFDNDCWIATTYVMGIIFLSDSAIRES